MRDLLSPKPLPPAIHERMEITWKRQDFGRLPEGGSVERYEASNGAGMSVGILTYGGIVQSLCVPDGTGRVSDVVLGFDALGDYLRGHPHFGAITGRVAGRITGGKFCIGDRDYALALNNGSNHLHGGFTGLDKRLWQAKPEGAKLVLRYRSPDGEEGYPGAVDLTVAYVLTGENELVITSEAVADQPTPVSLTNHSYFNLAGEGSGSVENHTVQILADEYVPTDEELTLSGRRENVEGRPNDLRHPRRLGDILHGLHLRHGDNYLLPPAADGGLREVARVSEPSSRRDLVVSSDEDCLQFYTGVFLDGSFTGKSGVPYRAHAGLCLECQGYPDGVMFPEFGPVLTVPEHPRHRTTVYRFGISS